MHLLAVIFHAQPRFQVVPFTLKRICEVPTAYIIRGVLKLHRENYPWLKQRL